MRVGDGMPEAIVEIVKFEIELVMFQFDSFKPVETRPIIWAVCELIPGLLESARNGTLNCVRLSDKGRSRIWQSLER